MNCKFFRWQNGIALSRAPTIREGSALVKHPLSPGGVKHADARSASPLGFSRRPCRNRRHWQVHNRNPHEGGAERCDSATR